MAHQPDHPGVGEPIPLHPWALLLVGGILPVMGLLLASAGLPLLQVLAAGAGLAACSAAVLRRLQRTRWDSFSTRLETSAVLGISGVAALLAWLGTPTEWDSARLLFASLALVALGAAPVLLLPTMGRRLALSLLVVFHFVGILTAVTSVDPPGHQGPWVAKQLWARLYRPYLSFLYMTNAYHFYSPDPGPPSLMWFAVHYTDGTYRWVKIPDRENSPVGMHYQRMLALPEHTFVSQPRLPLTRTELLDAQQQTGALLLQRRPWEEIVDLRQRASGYLYDPPIPYFLDLDFNLQYREPNDVSKKVMASVARHVFWTAPPADSPDATVKSVKVYRITQQVLTPQELVDGMSPLDKTKYWPFFMGEFDGQGQLVDPADPFLYWYLPILKVPEDYPNGLREPLTGIVSMRKLTSSPAHTRLLDCLELHAKGFERTTKPEGANP